MGTRKIYSEKNLIGIYLDSIEYLNNSKKKNISPNELYTFLESKSRITPNMKNNSSSKTERKNINRCIIIIEKTGIQCKNYALLNNEHNLCRIHNKSDEKILKTVNIKTKCIAKTKWGFDCLRYSIENENLCKYHLNN